MANQQLETLRKEIHEQIQKNLQEVGEQQKSFMAGIMAGAQPAQQTHGKGVKSARIIRAIAHAKGDPEKAAAFAQKEWNDEVVAKALTTGDASAGGFLVPSEESNEVIELLRSRAVVRRAQPQMLTMDNGNLRIPRIDGGATAEYIGESSSQNASQQTTGQVVMTWKKLRATVPIANELLATSDPSADTMVRDDMTAKLATREDQAFIRDDGTADTPKGMRYWAQSANVTATNGTSSSNVEQDIQDLMEDLQGNDVRMLRPAFFMSSRSKNHLINLRDSNGNLTFPEIRNENPTLMGFPVFVTNNIPNNLDASGSGDNDESEVYLVDMADAVIGETSQLIIEASNMATYTDSSGNLQSAFDRDETVIKALMRHDFAMRHSASVAVKTQVTWGV